MENLKENYNKIKEIQKENKKILDVISELKNKNNFDLYKNNIDEYKKNDDIIKKYDKKIELNNLKIAILKNNLFYLFKMNFEGIKSKVLEYYEHGKIGDKTKVKIFEEIKQYYNNNFNVNIGGYVTYFEDARQKELKINIYFLNDKNYKDFILAYYEDFQIVFDTSSYYNEPKELKIYYYKNIDNYVGLKDLHKTASELMKNYNKTVEKIEKLRIQQKELYHNFCDYTQGFIHELLNIKTDLRIY